MTWVWHKGNKKPVTPQWDAVVSHSQSGLLESVYAWERRCRGYDLYPYLVPLEPPFVPFDGDTSPVDFTRAALPAPDAPTSLSFFKLLLPAAQKVMAPVAAGWLRSLPIHRTATFEIIADSREIVFQLACSTDESAGAAASLPMHFPLANIEVDTAGDEDILRTALDELRGVPVGYQIIDFALEHFAYRPLRRFPSFVPDPLAPLVAAVAALEEGEVAGLQVLFTKAHRPWGASLERIAGLFSDEQEENRYGRSSYTEGEEMRLLRQKLASPLYAAVLRVFAVSRKGDDRAFSLCRRIGGALAGFTEPGGNALIALDNQSSSSEDGRDPISYPDEAHFRDLLARRSRRSGFLLSVDELVGLVHPPSETLHHPKMVRPDGTERVLPPHLLDAKGALLGGYMHRNRIQPVVWPDEFRNRHAYLLGATRMGKSTLLLNLITQDLEAGKGLCLIDPHGDLAKDVLNLVPSHRAEDVLYLDFGNRERPPAIGLLEAGDEWEKRLVSSDLLSVLRRLFASSWGDRLEHILRHALLTLLSDSGSAQAGHTRSGHTLRDIRSLLSDKDYRARVLLSVHDPELRSFWNGEFNSYSPSTFAPLYNKLGLLLSSPLVRNIVAQPQSRLDLPRIMREKKVLLVNLNSALVGEDNAHFLGALLVSKIQIAAMQSLRRERGERVPFTLYVDEFQNFVVSSFEKILSEAGKAGLSLVMANQFLEQLQGSLQSAILGNVGTLVSFRVSADSARLLEKELAGRFKAEEFISLERGTAVVRLGQALDSAKIHTLPPPQRDEVTDVVTHEGVNEIIVRTWGLCCRTRSEVEAEMAGEQEEGEASGATGKRMAGNGTAGDGADRNDKNQDGEEPQNRKGKGKPKMHSAQKPAADDDEPTANTGEPMAGEEEPLAEPAMFGVPDELVGFDASIALGEPARLDEPVGEVR